MQRRGHLEGYSPCLINGSLVNVLKYIWLALGPGALGILDPKGFLRVAFPLATGTSFGACADAPWRLPEGMTPSLIPD